MCKAYNSQKIGTGKMDSIPPAFPTKTAMLETACIHAAMEGDAIIAFPAIKN